MTAMEGIRVEPQYKERVWGDHNLHPPRAKSTDAPVGEAWIVYEGDRVASGPDAGLTLGEMASKYGAQLLGRMSVERTGSRFPLLIKLLDCQAWLSLQVHPDDEKAMRLEGPGHFGKTEAWYFLKAEPGARIISGLRPGVTAEQLAEAIRNGTIIDLAHYQPVEQGDAVLMLAGTIHALGPGLLVYEVQQTSDITYRIFDWNRPQTDGRALHIEQSIASANPALRGIYKKGERIAEGEQQRLLECPYFALDLIASQHTIVELDTHGETFHALTVTRGEMQAEGEGWSQLLSQYETVIVPAACGPYTLRPRGESRALLSYLPGDR
jgi:mannose-6-phosphate isomerase